MHVSGLIGMPALTASTTLSMKAAAGVSPPIVQVIGLPASSSGECGEGGSGARYRRTQGHIVRREPFVEIVTQRFPCRGIVVEEVGEQVTAGLGYRRIIFGHKVFHHGESNGHRHFVHDRPPYQAAVPHHHV